MSREVCILIPSYKPSLKLIDLLKEIRRLNTATPILIVDDGSGDEFSKCFQEAEDVAGVNVIHNAINLGKGAALKHGINYLLVHQQALKGIVTADGDGQHAANDILKVADELKSNNDSLILGCRTFGSGIPFRSLIGNVISRALYRLLLGVDFKDTQTGLRGIPLWLAKKTLAITANRYELETEQLVIAADFKGKIRMVPIETIYEDNNATSHFNPIYDSMRIYFSLFRYSLSSLVTAAVDMVFFVLALKFYDSIFFATMIGRAASTFAQYNLLKSFVFKTEGGMLRLLSFIAYVILSGLLSVGLQEQISPHIIHNTIAGKIIAESIIFIINYIFLRDTIFERKQEF